MKKHWVREDPQFFTIHELGWGRDSDVDVLHGVDVRLLSRDASSGSSTWMARFPAGWQASIDSTDASVELFGLEGDLRLNGEEARVGGYYFVPRGSGESELRS